MKLRTVYESKAWTWTTAIIILLNFILNLAEAELSVSEESTQLEHAFFIIEMIFMAFFLIEVVMNMYIHWFWAFWTNLWNVFDFIVVSVSIVEIILEALYVDSESVHLNIIRTFRVFRVLGLFNRFKQMQKVLAAVMASLQAVFSALLLLVVVISLYSLIGVQLFKEDNPQHYSSFTRALFTILGLATGD